MGQEQFLVQKKFSSKKNFGPKKILVQNNFWSNKKFGMKKNLGPKINFGPKKNLGQKKIWSEENVGPKKVLVWKKNLVQKIFLEDVAVKESDPSVVDFSFLKTVNPHQADVWESLIRPGGGPKGPQ